MGRFGREIALRTGNLDYFFETLKTELESETLGFEIFSSGSCELREVVGTSLVSATKCLKQAEYQDRTVCLSRLQVSEGNMISWFTSLKVIWYLLSCSELLST